MGQPVILKAASSLPRCEHRDGRQSAALRIRPDGWLEAFMRCDDCEAPLGVLEEQTREANGQAATASWRTAGETEELSA